MFGKIDRALKAQQQQSKDMGLDPDRVDKKLEKNDFFALWLSAMVTIFPAALGALAFMALIAWLLIP